MGVIANEQNTVYAGIQVNPPVFLKMKETPNKDYIAVNTYEPFAPVPAVSNDFSIPISSMDSSPDMPARNPGMAFAKPLSVKAIIYSPNGNNIAILSDGQNETAASAGQETVWGKVSAIHLDGVVIGQEKISARMPI